jgi:hypothetical protein
MKLGFDGFHFSRELRGATHSFHSLNVHSTMASKFHSSMNLWKKRPSSAP